MAAAVRVRVVIVNQVGQASNAVALMEKDSA